MSTISDERFDELVVRARKHAQFLPEAVQAEGFSTILRLLLENEKVYPWPLMNMGTEAMEDAGENG